METKILIFACKNDHYFIKTDKCPFCGEKRIKTYDYREGDCIDCGQLCPGYAYGCTEPNPLDKEDMLSG